MNKTHYSILAIVMVMTLGMVIAAPSALAVEQKSTQNSGQGTSQSQNGKIVVLSPQTSKQISSQSSVQAACIYVVAFCS